LYKFVYGWVKFHVEFKAKEVSVRSSLRRSASLRKIDSYMKRYRVSKIVRIRTLWYTWKILLRSSKITTGYARNYMIRILKNYRVSKRVTNYILQIVRTHIIAVHKRGNKVAVPGWVVALQRKNVMFRIIINTIVHDKTMLAKAKSLKSGERYFRSIYSICEQYKTKSWWWFIRVVSAELRKHGFKNFKMDTAINKYRYWWTSQYNKYKTKMVTGYTSLGCFKDTSKRVFSKKIGARGWTGQSCYLAAKKAGAVLFGVQDGGQCFYSTANTNYWKYGRGKTCKHGKGGYWTQNVYKITHPIKKVVVRSSGYKGVGCFKDNRKRVFPTIIGRSYTPA
jgi:hypothetical protein